MSLTQDHFTFKAYQDQKLKTFKAPIQYFNKIVNLDKLRSQEKVLELPKNVPKDDFNMFLQFINDHQNTVKMVKQQQLFQFLYLFRVFETEYEIEKYFIEKIVHIYIHQQNTIKLIRSIYNILVSEMRSNLEIDIWTSLLTYLADFGARIIFFLIDHYQGDLIELKKLQDGVIMNELIERAMYYYQYCQISDILRLMDFLLKVRELKNVFQLYSYEVNCQMITYSQEQASQIVWNINNENGDNFYRQSESPLEIEGLLWDLHIWKQVCPQNKYMSEITVSIGLHKTQNQEYFNKHKYISSYSAAGSKKLFNSSYQISNDSTQDLKMPQKHTIISFISILEIGGQIIKTKESESKINHLIQGGKNLANLGSYFILTKQCDLIQIKINLKVSKIAAMIISCISTQFSSHIFEKDFSVLNENEILTLFKHKFLNVKKEDDVVSVLGTWIQNVKEGEKINLEEILENINWSYVSLKCIIETMQRCQKLRENHTFVKYIRQILEKRVQMHLQEKSDIPQKQMKRQSYISENIEKDPNGKKTVLDEIMESFLYLMTNPYQFLSYPSSGNNLDLSQIYSYNEQVAAGVLLLDKTTSINPSRMFAVNSNNNNINLALTKNEKVPLAEKLQHQTIFLRQLGQENKIIQIDIQPFQKKQEKEEVKLTQIQPITIQDQETMKSQDKIKINVIEFEQPVTHLEKIEIKKSAKKIESSFQISNEMSPQTHQMSPQTQPSQSYQKKDQSNQKLDFTDWTTPNFKYSDIPQSSLFNNSIRERSYASLNNVGNSISKSKQPSQQSTPIMTPKNQLNISQNNNNNSKQVKKKLRKIEIMQNELNQMKQLTQDAFGFEFIQKTTYLKPQMTQKNSHSQSVSYNQFRDSK